jgi:hypothetical protein
MLNPFEHWLRVPENIESTRAVHVHAAILRSAAGLGRRFAVLATVACTLAGCSKILAETLHDLSLKDYTSEMIARVPPDWLNHRTNRFEVIMQVPRLESECPNTTERCKMPGPFHVQLLDLGNQSALVDKIVEAPPVTGHGGTGQHRYVSAQFLDIILPPGKYKFSLTNMSGNVNFSGHQARVRFQYRSKY